MRDTASPRWAAARWLGSGHPVRWKENPRVRRLESSGAACFTFFSGCCAGVCWRSARSLGGRAAAARKAKRSSGGGEREQKFVLFLVDCMLGRRGARSALSILYLPSAQKRYHQIGRLACFRYVGICSAISFPACLVCFASLLEFHLLRFYCLLQKRCY